MIKKMRLCTLAIILCIAILLSAFIHIGNDSVVAAAEMTSAIQVPIKAFISAEDMGKAENYDLSIANSDKIVRISFGQRLGDVKYYSDNIYSEETVSAGPITWLVAGMDEDGSLVLYSEKPLISAGALDSSVNSAYGTTYDYRDSNIQSYATDLYTECFSEMESNLIKSSMIQVEDGNTFGDQFLYAPSGNVTEAVIKVGQNDELTIHSSYCGGIHWLRKLEAVDSAYANYIIPNDRVNKNHVQGNKIAMSYACALDKSDIAFASVASVGNLGEGSVTQMQLDDPLTIRLNGTAQGKVFADSNITVDGSQIQYSGIPENSRLVVLFVNENGEVHQYWKNVSGSESCDLTGIEGCEKSCVAKAWIEADVASGGSLTYASEVVDINYKISDTTGFQSSPTANAYFGFTLNETNIDFAEVIGTPLDINGHPLEGEWTWKDGDASVGDIGVHTHKAVFIPTDSAYKEINVDVTVNVSSYTDKWGEDQSRPSDHKVQYIDSTGRTSIEIKAENVDTNGIIWVSEEAGDKITWYGLNVLSSGLTMDKGLRFYTQWIVSSEPSYNQFYNQIDESIRSKVKDNHSKAFYIGVEDVYGNKVQLSSDVNVYVQLEDDWDISNIFGCYVSAGTDEPVSVVSKIEVESKTEGTEHFAVMTIKHFSPYFIYEKKVVESPPNEDDTIKDDNINQVTSPKTEDENLVVILCFFVMVFVGRYMVSFSRK